MQMDRMASLVMKRQTWGPLLIVIGAYALFMIMMRTSSVGFVQYVGAGIAVLLVVAGVIMMFVQLRGEDVSISTTGDGDRRADPEHIVRQLGKNYDVLRRQTTQGFVLAGVFMALGVLVILSGSVGKLFGFAAADSDLTSIAGLIMEVISGTSLFVYRINFKRLNETSDSLDATWRILTAHRLTESLSDDKRAEATMKLIDALIAPATRTSANNTPEPIGAKRASGSA